MEVKATQCTWSSVPCSATVLLIWLASIMWQLAWKHPMLMVIQLDRNVFGGGLDCLCSHLFSTQNSHKAERLHVQVSAVFAKQRTSWWSSWLRVPHSPNITSFFSMQEQSQLPATILLAQHKVRAAQLETQIEQQKQSVKPTSLFSTGIHMVSATLLGTLAFYPSS